MSESLILSSVEGIRIGLVVAEWNREITEALFDGAEKTLRQLGCKTENIIRKNVPGSFELPLGAQWLIETIRPDAVICLGCVIQGETKHFEFISQSVADGIMNVGIKHSVPVIFGVLTTDNIEQALNRASGKQENKGSEAAMTALKMVALNLELKK